MPTFPSVTAAGAFESPAVQSAIKVLAGQQIDSQIGARVTALEADTGWRSLSSWTTAGAVTGDPLPSGIAPTPGVAGSVLVRRRGPWLLFAIRGATITGSASFSLSTPGWGLRGQYQSTESAGVRFRWGYTQVAVSPIGTGTVTLDASYGALSTAIVTSESFPTTMIGTPT